MSNFAKEKIWDGTNVAAVKPASTEPAATDPALVVAVSPNSASPEAIAPGGSAPAKAAQLGFLTGGVFEAVTETQPLPVSVISGGGGSSAIGSIDYSQDTARFTPQQINITSTTTVIAGVAGQHIRVYRMVLIVGGSSAGTIALGDTSPQTLFPASPFLPYSSFTLDLDAEPYVTTTTGEGLVITLSGITAVTGVIWYTQS